MCSEVLACQEESQLSSQTGLLCCPDSVSMEDLHCQKEAGSSKASSHHPAGSLQRTAGSKEIRCHAREVQGRGGEDTKREGGFEKEEGERKARS